MNLYGGIEAGGTKFVCIIASGPDDIRAETRFPTTTPDETLKRAIAFFKEQDALGLKIKGLGVGCFGPIELKRSSPAYGSITTTPKPYWPNTMVVSVLQDALGIPVAFDTDVNAAAVGEGRWGAAQGLEDFVYFTIGTGIGGGAIVSGKPMHGLVHPEMGHILLRRDPIEDPFTGGCPYHGDCFEGLCSGPAMEKRWGVKAEELPPEHPAWRLEAKYIAQALHAMICTLSPQRIIMGGGVMQQEHLFPMIREYVVESLRGYVQSPDILHGIQDYIVPPGLGSRAGVLGSLALAFE